jgi:4-hydroxy-3-methylbut-2-enyl diphosphate reductase
VPAFLIDGAANIDPAWLQGRERIGLTAGASAPELLVQGVVDRLRELGADGVRQLEGEPENVIFALPKELRITLVA